MRIEDINSETLARSREDVAGLLARIADGVREAASAMVACLKGGGTVFACGNGGSAAQAAHFAGELVGRFRMTRRALRAVSLSDNPAVVTSLSNDYSYDDVYARQIAGLARPGDVLLALSTSGNSENVVRACRAARENDVRVVALTGCGGGRLQGLCDSLVVVDNDDTARIQEVHLMAIHVLCDVVESELCG